MNGRALLLWSADHPGRALLVALLVTLFMGGCATQVQHRYEIEDFFPLGTPERADYEQAVEAFGRDDRAGLLVIVAQEPFGAAGFADVDAVTRELEALEDVERAVSIASARVPVRDADGDVRLERAVPEDSALTPERLKRLLNLYAQPPYAGALLSTDRKLTVIGAVLKPDRLGFAPRAALLEQLEAARDALRARGYEVHVAGYPMQRVRLARLAADQSRTYLPIALGLILIVLGGVFRSVASVVLPLAVALGAAVWTTGLMLLLGLPPNIFSPAVYVMVVVVGVADAVHLLARERELRAQGLAPEDALRQSLVDVGPSCCTASLTTALAFASLAFTRIPMIAHMGLHVALGVGSALALTLLLFPACSRWLGRRSAGGVGLAGFAGRVEAWVTRHPRRVVAAFALTFVVAVLLAARVQVNSPLLSDLDPEHPIRKTNRLLEERLSGVIPLDVVVGPPAKGSAASRPAAPLPGGANPYDRERMEQVDRLTRRLRAMPQVLWATSAADTLDRLGPLLKRVPETDVRALLPTALLLANEQVDPWVAEEHDLQRIRLRLRDLDTQEAFALFAEIDRAATEELGPGSHRLTGQGYLAQVANYGMVDHFQAGFWVALLGVALTLILVFRSPRLAALSLLPNLFVVVAVAGVMGAVGIELRYTSALVLSVVFGLAVDDTIHFLAQLRRQEQSEGDALARTCRVAGPGLVLTSLLLAVGFGALGTAAFLPLRIMGGLLALTAVLALAADLLLLPALLRLREPGGGKPRPYEERT